MIKTSIMIQTPFIKFPPVIDICDVIKLTSLTQLKTLEKKYDDFLEKYHHILLLQNTIEKYLDIRDAISIRLAKVKRETDRIHYYKNVNINKTVCLLVEEKECYKVDTNVFKCGCTVTKYTYDSYVKKINYCHTHYQLFIRKQSLEKELGKIKKTLSKSISKKNLR